MRTTGGVRRIDDLGRIVIPKEIRRTLRIKEGDPLEIYTDKENLVMIKYSPISSINDFVKIVADGIEFDVEGGKFTTESICFEVFSAFGTVGLTANLTTELSIGSKLILCLLMYIGRLGPMTMFSVFSKNINIESKLHYELVEEDLLIG